MTVSITSTRRICVGLIVIGAVLLFCESDTDADFGTVPLPGSGLSVKMTGEVKTEGNYHLAVGMAGPQTGLTDTVPCSLIVRVTQKNKEAISTEVTSLAASSEFGFAKVEYYIGGSWQLKPGEYDVEVKSVTACEAAMSRGAVVSFEQELIQPTEQYLQALIRHWCGVWFFWGGIVGIVMCEFRRPHSSPPPS